MTKGLYGQMRGHGQISEPRKTVLGIDAAWTERAPSGVALVSGAGEAWELLAVASSYEQFVDLADSDRVVDASAPDVLLNAASAIAGAPVTLVTVDMPLATVPMTGRRAADRAVSQTFGALGCSTHSPTADRPGKISERLTAGFLALGYGLAVSGATDFGRAVMEVYPHPALVALTGASYRLPYKAANQRKFWPTLPPIARRERLFHVWTTIRDALDAEISGVSGKLPLPSPQARRVDLKAFEDALDAVVCAWVGVYALQGRARAFGDETAAIWTPALR